MVEGFVRWCFSSGIPALQQNVLHVMVVQPSLFQCDAKVTDAGSLFCIDNQPWLTGPTFLGSTKHGNILEGLRRALPFVPDVPSAYHEFGRRAEMVVILLGFDAGSSCLLSYRCIAAAVELADDDNTCIHGELCDTHNFHKPKARCIARTGLNTVLFSIGKIVLHSRSVQSVINCIVDMVANNYAAKYYGGRKPDVDNDLGNMLTYIISIDGDDSLSKNSSTSWSKRVLRMLENCPFDRATGRWVIWKHESEKLSWSAPDRTMLKEYAQPLLDTFAYSRWDDGSISRWTGVMNTSKKSVAWGCVQPSPFGFAQCFGE